MSDIRVFRASIPSEKPFYEKLFYLADWDNEGVVTKEKIDSLKTAWDKIPLREKVYAKRINNFFEEMKKQSMY